MSNILTQSFYAFVILPVKEKILSAPRPASPNQGGQACCQEANQNQAQNKLATAHSLKNTDSSENISSTGKNKRKQQATFLNLLHFQPEKECYT